MKLEFIYTLNSELSRAQQTLGKRAFYQNHNYKPLLPRGVDLDFEDSGGLEGAIKSEFDEPAADSVKSDIQNEWNKHKDVLMTLFSKLSDNLPASIECTLTKYGVGGSYQLPNKVIINFAYKHHFKTLVHEFIHCLVQPIIHENKLDHASKEGLVDWLFVSTQT